MTASVVEAKANQGSVAAHTLTFVSTPTAGDIVVVAWVCLGTGTATFTVAGMGATWTVYYTSQGANANMGFAVGVNPSAAGNVVVTNNASNNSTAAAYLVRGADPLGNVRLHTQTSAASGTVLAGPSQLARDGEFVCAALINNNTTSTWPDSSSLPSLGAWTRALNFTRDAAYAIPSSTTAHQINATHTGTTAARIGQITIGAGDHKAQVGGVYTEVLGTTVARAQVGGVYTEVLAQPEGRVQVEALYAETLVTGAGRAQVESVYAESLVTGLGNTQVESVYAEALILRTPFVADPAYRAAVLADGPLGYWRLDETIGSTVTDYSGNARDGTYSGVVLGKDPLHAGSVGSVQGGSSGQGIGTVPNHASWAVGETFSLECWLMPTNTTDVAGIVGRFVSGTGGWVIWQRRGKLGVVTVKGGTQTDQDGYTLAVNTPVHFVLVSVPGRLKMYINGLMAFSWVGVGTYNAAVDTTALQFGGYNGAANYSQARLSDVAFYNVALSEAQIRAHLGLPWPPTALDPASVPGLIGRWDSLTISGLGEGSAVSSWSDSSGGGKHLGTIAVGRNPTYRTAVFNGRPVVRFDGLDDGLVATVVPSGADNQVTIIAVHALRSLASSVAAAVVTMQPAVATNSGYGMVIKATTGERSIFSVGVSAGYGGGVYTAGTWERWTLYSNESQSALLVNGAMVETAAAIAGVAAYLRLAGSPTQTLPAASDIAEVLVFDRVLTSYEIAQIDLYLKAKWFDTIAPPVSPPAFRGWGVPRIPIGAPAPTFAYYADMVLADGPNGYWRLGEASGATVDASGNGRDGAVSGTLTRGVAGLIADETDAATGFTGTGYYEIAYANSANITLECLVKDHASGNLFTRDNAQRIFQVQWGSGLPTFIFWTTGGGPYFCYSNGWRFSQLGSHHFACTFDGTTAKVYGDGLLLGTLAASGPMPQPAGTTMQIGSFHGSQSFTGVIDEAAQYPVALTETRLAAHAAAMRFTGFIYKYDSSSDVNVSNTVDMAFDGNNSTQWLAGTPTGWIRIQFPVARKLSTYSVRNHGNVATFYSKSWTFEAWDGTAWVVLDTVVNKTWSPGDVHTAVLPGTTAYTQYRVNVSANAGGAYCGFAEFTWVFA